MKKRILCFAFAFVMILSLGTSALAVDVDEQIDRIIEKQEPLIEMYNQILNAPMALSSGTRTFEYGGAWIDQDYLHINIVGDVISASTFYSDVCEDSTLLKFYCVDYSYADLCDLAYKITLIAPAEVISVGINEIDNCIVIGVNKILQEELNLLTEASQIAFLADIEKEINEAISSSESEDIPQCFLNKSLPLELVFENSSSYSATSLTGGLTLSNGSSYFSLGTCGSYWKSSTEKVSVLVTCGHGLTSGQTVYVNGVSVGTVIKKQFSGGSYYDYGVVEITNTSAFTAVSQVRGFSLTSEASSHPVGTTVKKYGMNGFAVGSITQTNVSTYYSNAGGYVYGLVRVDISSGYVGYCGAGDSGCTIYAGNTFYGVYSGDNKTTSSGKDATYFYYSPSYGISGFDIA